MANNVGIDLLRDELARKEKALEVAKVTFNTARASALSIEADVVELKRVIALIGSDTRM